MLEQELSRLIAERHAITARIYEIRRELDLDRRGRGVLQKGEFAGLPFRAVVYVRRAGFRTRAQLEELYQREGRKGIASVRRIGPGTAAEGERWLLQLNDSKRAIDSKNQTCVHLNTYPQN